MSANPSEQQGEVVCIPAGIFWGAMSEWLYRLEEESLDISDKLSEMRMRVNKLKRQVIELKRSGGAQ